MITLLKEIDLDKTGLLPPLISDYLRSKELLKPLYRYPFSFDAFADVIKEKQKDETDRLLLVEVLKDQYKDLQRSVAVDDNILSLLSDKTFTVVAAHQPCLFMGPLFNIYKIAGAVNLAGQLKKAFPDYHFVPVFWMGSEDHDTEELNHAYVQGKKFEWKEAGSGAIGRIKTEGMSLLIEELKTLPVNNDVISILESGLKKFETFGRFIQNFVHETFKEHGLVVLDQDDKRFKQSFAEIIKEEVTSFTAIRILKPALDLLEADYKVQAKPRDINFFYLGDGNRERILYNSLTQKFEVKDKGLFFTDEEMQAEIDAHPGRFSPNVIYRPIYQELILPNLAFIGGAGELSYWLELEALFDHYQLNFPMLVLRTSMAIVSVGFGKKLEKLSLDTVDLFGDLEQLIVRYVKDNLEGDIQLTEEKRRLEEIFNAISLKAESADPTLKQNVASEKQKALASFDNMEGKMLKAEKRKQETAINQIRGAHSVLFPDGVLQERRDGFLPYYDGEFIAEIVNLANPFDKTFKVIVKE
jgi:bacillithiol biosynthesis cysteine-adding enzyme BshC